jgi:hypothetical protein
MRNFFLLKSIKTVLFIVSCTIITAAKSQQDTSLNKSIFRVKAVVPILTVGAENEFLVHKNITVVPKIGATVISFLISSRDYGVTQGKVFVQYGILASVEARYFYNLNRRKQNSKTIHNFSGSYIAIEPFILSNSIAATNTSVEEKNGSKGVFLNWGFQKQFSKNKFIGGFIGFAPYIKPLNKIEAYEPISNTRLPLRVGISFGFTF